MSINLNKNSLLGFLNRFVQHQKPGYKNILLLKYKTKKRHPKKEKRHSEDDETDEDGSLKVLNNGAKIKVISNEGAKKSRGKKKF